MVASSMVCPWWQSGVDLDPAVFAAAASGGIGDLNGFEAVEHVGGRVGAGADGVEVVDAPVPEEDPAGAQAFDWRDVVGGDAANELGLADGAFHDQLTGTRIAGIEAALEADLEGDSGLFHSADRLLCLLDGA